MRRNILYEVANGEGLSRWTTRLSRRREANTRVAMAMLSELETRHGHTDVPPATVAPRSSTHRDFYRARSTPQGSRWMAVVVVATLIVAFVVVILLVMMRRRL